MSNYNNIKPYNEFNHTAATRGGVDKYIDELKKDPFYRLTANVRDADEAETSEILSAVDNLSDDDLTISSSTSTIRAIPSRVRFMKEPFFSNPITFLMMDTVSASSNSRTMEGLTACTISRHAAYPTEISLNRNA